MVLALQFGCKARIGGAIEQKKRDNRTELLPEALREAYRHDAAALAIRELDAGMTDPVSAADIPKNSLEGHYQRFGRLFQYMQKHPNIPDLSDIHIERRPDLKEVKVTISPDAEFAERWSQGFASTENLYLNQLIAKYKMRVTKFTAAEGANPTVILVAPEHLNTREFARLMKGISGIRNAEPVYEKRTGKNIRAIKLKEGGWLFSFIRGYGNCNPDCEYHTIWEFRVSDDGKTIKYQGQSGDPMQRR